MRVDAAPHRIDAVAAWKELITYIGVQLPVQYCNSVIPVDRHCNTGRLLTGTVPVMLYWASVRFTPFGQFYNNVSSSRLN